MKHFMLHYPVLFFVKGDVVYDENSHLLLVVSRVMHNPTLPIFMSIATENHNFYLNRKMPLTYSSVTKSLQYVCKISSLNRILNIYKVNHRFPLTDLGHFLRNFEALRTRQE